MKTRLLLVAGALAGLNLMSLGASRASAQEHPRLHAALYEMRQARTELREARHNFGGHRAQALAALDEAITQVDRALRAVGDNFQGRAPARDTYRGYANCPHIRHALAQAREARSELRNAAHNYKGHREQAVRALDAVIAQLDKALQYAR
jgi:hypothetical protein